MRALKALAKGLVPINGGRLHESAIDSALNSVEQLTEAEKIFLLMGELGGRS